MRSIIVGTAGHIDHGKTALVRALTGVDADRLPEEKRRGITIDLGFAELDLGDVRLGFVDVPGHERFVKNMLAGAHGIDLVALVIAADEGVMPQTREHFDICRLLHIKSGLVIIAKSDKVDEEFLALVRAEAEELVSGSFLEGAPVAVVSARTGSGIEELKKTFLEIGLGIPERVSETIARLPIDRAFTMRGFGAVVTGTLVGGSISEGDEMELLPDGIRVRIRGLQVHGNAVGRADAGQRTAANLVGVDTAAIERGMTLAPAGRLRPTQIIDALVEVLGSAPRPLRSRVRVRVHLGTAEVLARVQVLESGGEISPGSFGLAQLRLENPVIALPGERFIVRSYSPSTTIAGGRVLDPFAVKHRGRELSIVRARLTTLITAGKVEQLAHQITATGKIGLGRMDLAQRTAWSDRILNDVVRQAVEEGVVVDAGDAYISRASFNSLSEATTEEVEKHHAREPLSRGLSRETLREQLFASTSPGIFRAVLAELEDSGIIASEKEIVRAGSHSLKLSPVDTAIKDSLDAQYRKAAMEPPQLDEALARASNSRASPAHARAIIHLLIEAGTLVRVDKDLLFHKDAIDRLLVQIKEYAAAHEPERLIDIGSFKNLAGVSRKYAIPLLEYLDREHITRRAGDKRVIL